MLLDIMHFEGETSVHIGSNNQPDSVKRVSKHLI